MQSIEGQTALVTGGAKRIGRAIALALAEAGVDVAIHYHESHKAADATAADVRQLGVNAVTISADLTDPWVAEVMFDKAVDAIGPIDILVNNASTFLRSDLRTCSEEELQAAIRLHAVTPLMLARRLAATGQPGNVINLLDTRVAQPDPAYAAYSLSKRMLADLTAMLALELAPTIRVNGVAPGPILPPEGADAGVMAARARALPLQRSGDPADVAAAVLFLLRSDFITGQTVYVDGGAHLKGDPDA
jgi:NAD(P)-dependent dehydrogenase (short-subunit alcohol dehydrogenase family)